ncbi:MAG: hypothetical protein Q7S33_05125 [Nanoarchaeota archaeon]|nr:hypothetical protein [Nanoarchaeota archaeon]
MALFSSPFFVEGVLPFLLVFVLIFAILQKSKILGDGKAQIDALISLAIALILIGVAPARDIIVNLMPWLAVALVVILVFLLLYGFVAGDLSSTPTWMKVIFGVLSGIFVIALVIYVTGFNEKVSGFFSGGESWANVLFIAVIIAAFVVAITTGGGGSSSSGGKRS